MKVLRTFCFFVVIVAYLLSGCSNSSPLSIRLQAKIEEGKSFLEDGDFQEAKRRFKDALDIDNESPEALFGYAYSSIFVKIDELNKTVVDLINLISTLGLSALAPSSDRFFTVSRLFPSGVTWGGKRMGINALIFELINYNFLSFMEDLLENYIRPIEEKGELNFYLENFVYTINLGGVIPFQMDLSGEYDLGEVYFIDFIFSLLDGLFKIILSPNYNFNIISTVVNGFVPYAQANDWPSKLTTDPLSAISNLVAYMLNREPDLLDFEPTEGKAILTDAANWLGTSFEKAYKGLNYIFNETDPQNDDLLARDENKENAILIPARINGEFTKISVDMPANIQNSFQRIQDNLSGGSNVRISWANDVAPILAVGVYMVISSGLVDSIIDMVLQNVGDESMVKLIKSFIDPTKISVNIITALITSVIGDVIELDLGHLLRNPTPLRRLLPAWAESANDPAEEYLVFEYECGANDRDSSLLNLICKEGTSQDSPHFLTGTYSYAGEITGEYYPQPIPADGVPSLLPYVAWQSPDFGGLLYINYHNLRPTKNEICGRQNTDEFVKPNLCEMNAFTIDLFNDLLKAVQSLGGGGSSLP